MDKVYYYFGMMLFYPFVIAAIILPIWYFYYDIKQFWPSCYLNQTFSIFKILYRNYIKKQRPSEEWLKLWIWRLNIKKGEGYYYKTPYRRFLLYLYDAFAKQWDIKIKEDFIPPSC